MFSGLVYCSDCGEKLYYGATNNYRTEGAFFDCSLHWKHKDKCGTHYIREKILQQLVLQHIQMVTGYIYRHEAHFRQVMVQQLHAERAKQIAANSKALERIEKRISELKRLFIKIYEDNTSGKRRQHIHIHYDGLGSIPLNELLQVKRRDRRHAFPSFFNS